MDSQSAVFVVLLLALAGQKSSAAASKGGPAMCYLCTSLVDKGCGDPFNPARLSTGLCDAGCLKVRTTFEGFPVVYRMCAKKEAAVDVERVPFDRNEPIRRPLGDRSAPGSGDYECGGDLCNTAAGGQEYGGMWGALLAGVWARRLLDV